jgi:predicted TIM-barrel fold metal-dependent hydrolase
MIALLDTHQHLIYPDRCGYAWTDGIPLLARQAFTLEDYQALTAANGVAATIFMEAGVDDADYQAEARFIATLAANPDSNIIGMIASCRPEQKNGFEEWLDECADMPIVGLRRILHEIDDDLSRSETFRANVRKIGARNLTFDMCFRADQLTIAADLAHACPDTQFILDHCGVPDIAGGRLESWKQGITAVAALPNIAGKISGIMAYCTPGTASLDTLRPYLEHIVESFGPDRLVWGSDWPVVNLGGGLPDWIAITRQYLESWSEEEVEQLAHGNAARIYNVTP